MQQSIFRIFRSFKKAVRNAGIAVVVLTVSGCSDVFETDIESDSVTLVAPTNNLQTVVQSHLFKWEALDGAKDYRCQVTKPSFDTIEQFVLDTLIESTSVQLTLGAGSYQWRVRGENNATKSRYTTYNLQIDTTSDLSVQTVILTGPVNNYVSNSLTQNFTWFEVNGADLYRVLIKTPDFNGALALPEATTVSNAHSETLLDEGLYEWGVRAENATTNTLYTSRMLSIDTTVPGDPTLNSPADTDTLPDAPTTFAWSRPADTGSNPTTLSDSIIIYNDAALTTLKAGYYTTATTKADSLGPGTYYWWVRSFDAAGNASGYSTLRQLTVQ